MKSFDFRIKKWQLIRKKVFEKDNFTCKYCGYKPSTDTKGYTGKYTLMGDGSWLEVDHIKPKSLGGKDDIENLQTLCHRCNVKKGSIYRR